MFGLSISAELQPWFALAILAVMFVLFVLERTPVEVTAIGGAAAMLILGILPVKEATSVLSNSAPWTIAMMFLVMGGLVRTGAVEAVINLVTRHAGTRPKTVIVVLLGSIAVASAFMNNTPLVAVMIPVVMQLAVRVGVAPSKLLIPLSYMTVLGGMITLIGTSTNILVDGVAKDAGLEHFGLFEVAPLGIAVTLAGGLFLGLFGAGVERTLGSWRMLVLFLVAGAAANLFAALMSPLTNAPIIGSSGAVSALIGAYVLLFPTSHLGVILPLGLYFQLVRVPAIHLIGIWLLFQVLETLGSRSGAIAWWAHVFGFANGLFLALTLRPWLYRRDARMV